MTTASLSLRLLFTRFQRAAWLPLVALLSFAAAPVAQAANIVAYSPTQKTAGGVIPFIFVYSLDITSPDNTPTGTTTTIAFNKAVIRAPIDTATALSFLSFSPSTLDFTGPAQTKTVQVRLSIPTGTTGGSFGYKVTTSGFPAGTLDLGHTFNGVMTVAPDIPAPTVAVQAPLNLQVFNVNPTDMPLQIPLSFTAQGTTDYPVLSVDASVDGSAIIPLTETQDDQGVITANGTMVISNAGTYTVLARGTSEGGTTEVARKFTVNVNAPPPTVTITAPAPGAVFTYNAGTTPTPTTQFLFQADSEFGAIREITADLNGVPVIFSTVGINTLHATCTTPNLALSAAGVFALHVTARTDYGTTEASRLFAVNIIYPTPTIAIDGPTNNSTVSILPGDPVPYEFTTSTTAGFSVDSTTIAVDGGAAVAPGNVIGLGSQHAVSVGNLLLTPGPHSITVTGVSAGVSVSATSNFNVVIIGTPPAITSANNATFTYGQAGSFTVTGTGVPTPTFSVTGALPAGVTFNGTAFVGTPTVVGSFPLTITATNGVSPSAAQPFTLTVAKALATISVTNSTYVYNATARTATVTTTPGSVAYTVTYNGLAALPVNAGTYNVVATVNDPFYFAAQPALGTLTITKVPVTVSGTVANNKVYNGNATATLASVGTLNGAVPGDAVSLDASAVSATFADKNAAAGKTVTIAGLALTGASAGNYSLTQPTATATISPAPLAVTGVTAQNKTYDRTTAATLAGVGTAGLSGKIAGDAVTLGTAGATGAFVDANAGTGKTVTISGFTISGADAGNYTLAQPTAQAAITPKAVTITASPVKDYDGTTVATLSAGNTTLGGVISPDAVTINFSGVTAAYNDKNAGTNKPVTITGTLTLAGAQAGNYAVGTVTAAGEIRQVTPVITWANPASIVYGTALSATQLNATANVAGSFLYAPASGAVLDAGSQTLAVTFTPTDTVNYKTLSTTRPLTVEKATPVITFGALPTKKVGDAPFALGATVNNAVQTITYASGTTSVATISGSTLTVVGAGTSVITASVAETTNYKAASATQTLTVQPAATSGTALVRHGITLNGQGGIDGSIQVLLPEGDTLNGNAFISGSLLVAGTPTIVANGHPTYTLVDGTGAASPTNYSVILNGNALVGKIVRRTDAISMPTVAAPPAPTGTRSVVINSGSGTIGTWSTLKNLTLNGNSGIVAVPPGTYGKFIANGSSSFQLGVAGATTPSVYNFQSLTLNGNSDLQVVGPVVITLANGVAFNGNVGTENHPEWVTLKVASGGVTLNGNVEFNGFVVAPSGTVILNGNNTLFGGVTCDRLTINGGGLLDLLP